VVAADDTSMSRRSHAPSWALIPFGLAAAAFLLATRGSLGISIGLDYEGDAARSVSALAHGHLAAALSQQPLMGFFSVVLRAPFVALAPAGNLDAQYLLGLLPCMAVVVALVLALRRQVAARRPESRSLQMLPWLCLFSAPVAEALLYGHPEEPLAGALLVGAALASMRRRSVLAGLLLGLAVATKQWGAFAIVPILAAGTGSRVRTALVAAAVIAAFTLPLAAGNGEQLRATTHQAATVVTATMTPLSLWAPASPGASTNETATVGGFASLRAPGYAGRLSRPLMALAILVAGLLALRRRRRPEDVLGLLALVFLARCLFDPVDNVYYHAPFLLSLVAWEALRHGRVPVLSLISASVLGAIALESRLLPDATTLAMATYLLWAIPLAIVLTRSIVRRPAPAAAPARSGPLAAGLAS
jgi:hypothetical protein